MLNSVQEKRQLSSVGLDVTMALDRGWAANFCPPDTATSRCNRYRCRAIKSSGLEMATSEVPNLPPYLPMHFLGYGESPPLLRVKPLHSITRAAVGEFNSFRAGCRTIDTLLNGLMKHPQIPLRSSSTASTSASAKTRFLDYLLDSCSGPKQSKTVTSLLLCTRW